jgi:hypothetical protein
VRIGSERRRSRYCGNDTAGRKSLAAQRESFAERHGFRRVLEQARKQMTLPHARDAKMIVPAILS